MYSSNWKYEHSISIHSGGLGEGKQYGNSIYIPITGIPSHIGNQILKFDTEKSKISYIDTLDYPVDLVKDTDFLYIIHNSNMDYGIVTKIDIAHNKIVAQKKVSGVLRKIDFFDNNLYIFSDHVKEKKQSIEKLDLYLNIEAELANLETGFAVDTHYYNNKYFIVNNAKRDFQQPANSLSYLNLENKKLEQIPLSFLAPFQAFSYKNKLILTQYNIPQNTGFIVNVINEQLQQKKYTLKNVLFRSTVQNHYFYSTDQKNMYMYDIDKNFLLLATYPLAGDRDLSVSDFFILQSR
ncbi:hypothetical protein [Paenibacillus campi]|uniref:hypothetical protein n=1 Tax=Paenibacillus campi TaxID=3106031 RepID=UPI002B000016|nr:MULTISPECIES: hypothetical protein [unclassified Paenibacillus]